MPGLYIPFRTFSSSSTSRPAGAPLYVPASSSRHRQVAPAAPARPALPAFHTSARNVLDAAAGQPIPEQKAHGTSSINYSSSGSLHLHDPSSVCLAAMVHDFLAEEEEEEQKKVSLSLTSGCGRARCNCVDSVCGAEASEQEGELFEDNAAAEEVEQLCEILEGYTGSCTSNVLLMEVEKAMEELTARDNSAPAKLNGASLLRRAVMTRLRVAGYNAAACKSRWNFGDGLPAGDYEYIDVLMEGKEGKEERLIVDIDFKAQFEIARPSTEYARMLNVVPKVFAGRASRVKQIVKMLSHAAKRSLKAHGLMMPPWRKYKYMQAKWLSPVYRRTTNMEPARHTYKSFQMNTQEDNVVGFAGAKCSNLEHALVDSKLEYARLVDARGSAKHEESFREKRMRREDREEKGVARGFEAMDLQYMRRALFYEGKCREVCTAMCTSWQLPSLKEKPIQAAPLVSGLSFALQEQRRQVSVVS